ADGATAVLRQHRPPLVQEDARRNETQARKLCSRDRPNRNVRLPAASREDDDPSVSSRLPQLQRGILIVAQLEAGERQLRYADERRGFVRHADTLRTE